MQQELGDLNLCYSIGGQISFDVFPKGWDKTFCLTHIGEKEFDEIHFFGDKTFPGTSLLPLIVWIAFSPTMTPAACTCASPLS